MPEQAAQQGHAAMLGSSRSSAGPRIPENRASSRSTVIGVAGVLLTAAAIAGVVMMTGSASAPVTTQVAAVSAPYAVAQTPAVAPAPVAPAQVIAPATNVAPALPPVVAPAPAPAISDIAQFFAGLARPAPALNAPGQCEVGQMQQLAITLFASRRADIGNVIRIYAGSYVSPPIVLTRSSQTVTFPVPPGSRGWTRIIVEQSKANGGSTYEDDETNGITIEHEGRINPYQDVDLIRWTTPRC